MFMIDIKKSIPAFRSSFSFGRERWVVMAASRTANIFLGKAIRRTNFISSGVSHHETINLDEFRVSRHLELILVYQLCIMIPLLDSTHVEARVPGIS